MKRQGGKVTDQPPVKKPDTSTDLRSKIGAKLQTLLNGIESERRRRRIYEDLFGEPQHSSIIIDPTIVIKSEPEDEDCSNDSLNLLDSQKFVTAAKNRLNELLNKQHEGGGKFKDSGKENTLFGKNKNCSSGRSSSSQSISSGKTPLNNKRGSIHKQNSNSSSDIRGSQPHMKNVVVVLEDIRKSKHRTKLNHSAHTKHLDWHTDVVEADSDVIIDEEVLLVDKSDSSNVASNSLSSNNNSDVFVDNTSVGVSNAKPQASATDKCINKNSSRINVSRSQHLNSSRCVLSNNYNEPKAIDIADILLHKDESLLQIPHISSDDSEVIDDPIMPEVIVDIKVDEVISTDTENPDPEVVLLGEKTPTHEVITLEEEDDDSSSIIEEIHKCNQCGKAFRLKSLLNFHIRMHGTDSFASSSSLSII